MKIGDKVKIRPYGPGENFDTRAKESLYWSRWNEDEMDKGKVFTLEYYDSEDDVWEAGCCWIDTRWLELVSRHQRRFHEDRRQSQD